MTTTPPGPGFPPPPGGSPGPAAPYDDAVRPVGPVDTGGPGHPAVGPTVDPAVDLDKAYPPLEYHLLQRAGDRGWWRGLVGVIALAAAMMLVLPIVTLVVFIAGVAVTGGDAGTAGDQMLDIENLTPLGLAYLMTTLALLIPAVWIVVRLLHGLKPRWTTSVAPRMRWGYFAACVGLSVVALFASLVMGVVVSALDPNALPGDTEVAGQLNAFTSTTRDFLIVVLLLTPLQAAGEEYLFRGYLTQVCGGIFATPRVAKAVAVLVPALLFALAHGVQDPPVFFDRFAFGVMAGILVILTGGLEAAIAMHVLNNWAAFGLALAFGDIAAALTPTGGSWLSIPVTLTQTLVYLGLAVLVHRWMGLARTAESPVLIASRGRVYGFSSAA